MPGRLILALVGLLLVLGCTPVADGPVAALPPDEPRVVIDAAGAPGDEPTAEPDGDDGPQARPGDGAPASVTLDINARYDEQTDPDKWAKRFEREGREVFDRREAIVGALGLRPGMAVADVGAGTGLLTLDLAQAVGADGTVYAVDVQAYFLDHIGQKAKKAGLDNVELVRARQDAVGLPDESVDLVLMCDVYHHVEKPAPYLASIHAALRPGGRLVVIDYRRIEGESEEWLLGHIRASPDEFRIELESAGFTLVSSHEGVLEENFFFELKKR